MTLDARPGVHRPAAPVIHDGAMPLSEPAQAG